METQELKVSSDRIMPPSPLVANASRHGRGKHGGSISKNKVRGRGYSIVDERELLISKALSKMLKHTVYEDEDKDNSDGWVNCEDLLARSDMSVPGVTFTELKAICENPKSKFTIRINPDTRLPEENSSSAYLIRINPTPATAAVNSTNSILTPLSSNTIDLPKLIIFETSYANYPLILASGGIRRAGGQVYLSFKAISLIDTTELPPVTADVSIYIDLPSAMEANKSILWQRYESGVVVTEGDDEGMVDKSLWKNVVARRIDIGVLFEDGQVKKEIPLSLRGKGAKVKKRGKIVGNEMNEIVALEENKEIDN